MQSECVELHGVLPHARNRVWGVLGSPELYPRFVRGVTYCERLTPRNTEQDLRYAVRARFDDGDVVRDEVRALVYRRGEQVVWTSVLDERRWFSIRLKDTGDGQTVLNAVLGLPPATKVHGSAVTRPAARRRLQELLDEVLRRLDDHLAERPAPLIGQGRKASTLAVAHTLVEAGVLAPSRPDRMLRQLSSLARWGPTVAGGYRAAAGRGPDDPAFIDERGARTFGEVDERSTRLAAGLAAAGVGQDTQVAMICRNHGAMVEALVACGKLGAHVLLLNTGMSAQQLATVVQRHSARVLLYDDEFSALGRYLGPDVVRISTWSDGAGAHRAADTADIDVATLDELAGHASADTLRPPDKPGRLVVLTSGTTGTPKGARRPTPNGLGDAAGILSRIPLRAGERVLVAAPLFHTWGLAALQLGMPLRATLVLRRRFDAEDALRTIAQHRCTALFAVPVMLQRILDLPAEVRARYDTSCLRIVASSGSALPAALVDGFMDAFGDVLYNLYGSTEVSWASIADPADLRAAPTTAGRPPLGTRVAVLGRTATPAPPGTVGRIFVGNDMLFEGYTDGLTNEVEHELMNTGDQGFLDADGRLFVAGRDDEMIVSGGENVFPRSVEEILAALPQVREAAVIGVPDAEYGQRLVAFIALRDGARLDEDTVQSYVHGRLARFCVPREVTFVPELPRNATGKILKRLLEDGDW
ncbi:Acyl-CoA synthetase (AMP-forming)/AMP-acid ligase II [Amycolatopsis marina]|uniref:Acyl-CoA synthetase (AMP-forming)/AMP-acid ligase II n=1 Tax=Amycolatopsis marina TaxID=490629 RepID=A0A1I1CQV9_9PSEU|nr:AMP-binding protein [Amycolatopsis marina]SFB62980.1 Acyl-CoA synthetase (AMP-forming)/AMP-acid ligase II [Amycolatopsis marina]